MRSKFWNFFRNRSQINSFCKVPPSQSFDHFSYLFGTDTCDQHRNYAANNDNYDREYFGSLFTESQFRCLLKIQPSGKATCPDEISDEISKNQVYEIEPLLDSSFIVCWISGTFLDQRKVSYLIQRCKEEDQKMN